jgi:hypothetical protein
VIIIYFIAWPVPIDPVAWIAPPNPGYTGPYEVNERLKPIDTFPIAGNHGPEDISIDASVTETDNHIYIGSLVAPVLGRIEKERIGL